MSSSSFIILNGFDRSGTSAISRTLASHPSIELIMQPFNSGFLREKMYQVFSEQDEDSEAHRFFRALEHNRLENDIIKSHWHFKYSTTQQFIPGKLHLIKTTINHFAQRWMKDNFPSIDVWGIWREPVDIVSSIIRNGFYGEWYSDGINEIVPTLKEELFLGDLYLSFAGGLETNVQKTAFLLAVRTHFFLEYLDADKLLVYEDFRNDPYHLTKLTNFYRQESFDFKEPAKKDLNIIGHAMAANTGYDFSASELDFMEKVFTPIQKLKVQKFKV